MQLKTLPGDLISSSILRYLDRESLWQFALTCHYFRDLSRTTFFNFLIQNLTPLDSMIIRQKKIDERFFILRMYPPQKPISAKAIQCQSLFFSGLEQLRNHPKQNSNQALESAIKLDYGTVNQMIYRLAYFHKHLKLSAKLSKKIFQLECVAKTNNYDLLKELYHFETSGKIEMGLGFINQILQNLASHQEDSKAQSTFRLYTSLKAIKESQNKKQKKPKKFLGGLLKLRK